VVGLGPLVALLTIALASGLLSGVGLVLAAVGFRSETGWRARWGVWLPAILGASMVIAVGTLLWTWAHSP
jgi:hypothetical protein